MASVFVALAQDLRALLRVAPARSAEPKATLFDALPGSRRLRPAHAKQCDQRHAVDGSREYRAALRANRRWRRRCTALVHGLLCHHETSAARLVAIALAELDRARSAATDPLLLCQRGWWPRSLSTPASAGFYAFRKCMVLNPGRCGSHAPVLDADTLQTSQIVRP